MISPLLLRSSRWLISVMRNCSTIATQSGVATKPAIDAAGMSASTRPLSVGNEVLHETNRVVGYVRQTANAQVSSAGGCSQP